MQKALVLTITAENKALICQVACNARSTVRPSPLTYFASDRRHASPVGDKLIVSRSQSEAWLAWLWTQALIRWCSARLIPVELQLLDSGGGVFRGCTWIGLFALFGSIDQDGMTIIGYGSKGQFLSQVARAPKWWQPETPAPEPLCETPIQAISNGQVGKYARGATIQGTFSPSGPRAMTTVLSTNA